MSQSKSTEDDIRREILALADACVLCGQCLPVCPTYALDQREAESPRGRIVLIQRRAITSDSDSAVDSVALDHCLSCGRCEAICPATVKFARLMDLNRQLRRPRRSSSWMMRALLALVARPALLAWMVRVTAWPARWLPGRWMRLARVLQTPQIRKMPTRVQDSRPAVIVFAGCIERHAEQAALAALRRILHRLGWQVVDLPNQGCCGALARHAGDATAADRLRQSNQRALAAVLSDGSVRPGFVLTLSTGCHDEVRNALGESLPVMEAMAFLLAHTSLRTWRFRPLVDEVVLHSPCTSRPNPETGQWAAEAILRLVPELKVRLMARQGCCGAAGAHMLQFPQRAAQLAAPLLVQFSDYPDARRCTSNVGCHLHLQSLAEPVAPPMQHPLEVIDEAM